MEDEGASTEIDEDNASVLAMLFGLHLGYTTVTPFKLFALDHAERISSLVDHEINLTSSAGMPRVAVYRQVQSREFKKLSPESLEAYKIEAEKETYRNKSYAEAPATEQELFRYELLSPSHDSLNTGPLGISEN